MSLTETIARLRELEAKASQRPITCAYLDALRNAAPALLDAAERAEQADVDRIVAVVMRKDAEAERDRLAARVKELEATVPGSWLTGGPTP